MDDIEIREMTNEEAESRRFLTQYAFSSSPKPLEKFSKDYFKECLRLGIYKKDKLIGTATSVPHSHNVRECIYEMAGIAAVTTEPEYRRKGYVKKLMRAILEKEKLKPFSVLYPFKQSFYARMGYITLPQARYGVFSPNKLQDLLRKSLKGYVKRKHIADAFEEYEMFLKERQTKIHGMSLKTDLMRESLKDENKYWLALAYNESDQLIAVLKYKMEGFWKPFKGEYLYWKTEQGKYLLLQYLAKHADHCSEIHLKLKPTDRLEHWYFDLEPKIFSRDWVASPMARIINVEKIDGMSVEGNFRLLIKLKDDFCPWNSGTFLFSSVKGKLSIKRTQSLNSDIKLSIEGLSAIIYGGYSPKEVKFRSWGNFNNEEGSNLIKMFPSKLSHIHETF